MFLAQVHMVDTTDNNFVVSLALVDWRPIDTEWMDNPMFPNNSTNCSSIDISILNVSANRHEVNGWFLQFANIANNLEINGVKKVSDAVKHIKQHHSHLNKFLNE